MFITVTNNQFKLILIYMIGVVVQVGAFFIIYREFNKIYLVLFYLLFALLFAVVYYKLFSD